MQIVDLQLANKTKGNMQNNEQRRLSALATCGFGL
jgi:hypothetical protein